MNTLRKVGYTLANIFQAILFGIGISCLVGVGIWQYKDSTNFQPIMPLASTAVLAKTVMIDPGHGGSDPGAISCLGYYEKDLNLQVAKKLSDALETAGWKVVMTRKIDMDVSLSERVALSNVENPYIFISIHADSWTTPEPTGCSIFVSTSASEKSKE